MENIPEKYVAKGDLLQKSELGEIKIYPTEALEEYAENYKSLLQKSEEDELLKSEQAELNIYTTILESVKKVNVIDDNLEKGVLFIRTNDDIIKGYELMCDYHNEGIYDVSDILEKAKYFKREETPGNYKYYYTEEQYNKGKDSKEEDKTIIKKRK